MQCEQARTLLGAYLDDELTGGERQGLREHLNACGACQQEAAELQRVKQYVANLGRETTSSRLAERVRGELARAEAEMTPVIKAGAIAKRDTLHAAFARRPVFAMASASAAAVLLTFAALQPSGGGTSIERDVVAAHVRSLLQDSPFQVASADTHTVKPWFVGRIDYSPAVKDLTGEGFPLAGARLDYVNDKRIGALVYRRRLHVINVFLWPSHGAETTAPRVASRKGFNLVTWSKDGLTYWAVSDLNSDELMRLQSLL